MDWKEGFSSWENLVVIVCGIALIVSAFLTWVTGTYSAELQALVPAITDVGSLSGIAMKFGYASAACGLISLVLFFVWRSRIVTAILGAAAFLVGGLIWIYNTKVVPAQVTTDIVMHTGMGVYITMVAGIGLAIGAFLMKKN